MSKSDQSGNFEASLLLKKTRFATPSLQLNFYVKLRFFAKNWIRRLFFKFQTRFSVTMNASLTFFVKEQTHFSKFWHLPRYRLAQIHFSSKDCAKREMENIRF